jgi:hypothetical protein
MIELDMQEQAMLDLLQLCQDAGTSLEVFDNLVTTEFPDGQIKEYAANIIAENMLTQVDSDGYSITMMDGIIDYRKDDAVAVAKSDNYVVT